MKTLLLFLFSLILGTSLAQGLRNGRDYAVFFVATEFKNGWAPLPYGDSEISSLANDLESQYGFEIEVIRDARLEDIQQTLEKYRHRQYKPDDQLLLFFSMHGYCDSNLETCYLIPSDGRNTDQDPFHESWAAHDWLARITEAVPCRRIMISIDANCGTSTTFSSNNVKRNSPAHEIYSDCEGRLKAAFSGNEKTRKFVISGAESKGQSRSIFVRQWLRALRQGGGVDGLLSFEELISRFNEDGNARPDGGNFGSDYSGDFMFVRKNGCAAAANLENKEQELALWKVAESTNTLEAFQYYLNTCTDCYFEEAAREGIKSLQTFAMPQFPWPPPQCFLRQTLVNKLARQVKTFGQVDDRIQHSLIAQGYSQRSYFQVPGGFAIVTQLEQFDEAGKTKEHCRWIDYPVQNVNNIWDYLTSLVMPSPGHFRIFVFVVTDQPYLQANRKVSKEEATAWVLQGLNRLPTEISKSEVTDEHYLDVLIYEFEASQATRKCTQKCPCLLDIKDHLAKSGLFNLGFR